MKKTKYIVFLFLISFALFLASCDNRKITNYYLNESGNLIVEYDNGETTDLGDFDESIIKSINSVSFSNDGYYIIGGVKTAIKVDFSKVEMSEDGYYVINDIKTNVVAINIYKVEFTNCASITTQRIKEGYKVQRPQDPQKEGYTFEGWYCNGEEWRFNSDVVMNDMVLTAKWTSNNYVVSFNNSKGTNPNSISVTFDSSYTLPSVDSVEGYTFDGWYYNDVKVDSDKWNIAEDVELTANWVANENTITLDAKEGNVSISSVKVTYGEDYKLPVPTNEYGVFNGWLYKGELITDSLGNSLEPWTYTQDITVSVDWIIHLSTVQDLQKLNQYKNALFSLDTDLDISGIEWTPIGTESDPFTGTINGNNHKLIGLTITTYCNDIKNYGLIGSGNKSIINDLILENVNIELGNVKNNIYVGAIVGRGRTQTYINEAYSVINNCSVSGSVEVKPHSSTYTSYVGGISGCDSIVNGSLNSSLVSGHSYAGGIIGYFGTANNCENTGMVSANYAYGISYSNAKDCKNSGLINGGYAGGITFNGLVEKCLNTGKVIGVTYAGGIAAYLGSAMYSVNEGEIECEGMAGGLMGIISPSGDTYCKNSYNKGSVTGKTAFGIGSTFAYNCYNIGKIAATGDKASGIGSYIVQQCVSFGEIAAPKQSDTYAISVSAISGYDNMYFIDCYYGQKAAEAQVKYGTETNLKYEKELYVDLMYWDEYNSMTGEGYWIISEKNYPTLWWEN